MNIAQMIRYAYRSLQVVVVGETMLSDGILACGSEPYKRLLHGSGAGITNIDV